MDPVLSGHQSWRRVRVVRTGAAPAAGVDPTITVPGGKFWTVRNAFVSLLTSGIAGTRTPMLQVTVDGTIIARIIPNTTVGASGGLTLFWAQDVNQQTGNGSTNVTRIPEFQLPAGSVVGLSTSGIDAGDQYGALGLYVTEQDDQGGPTDTAELLRAMADRIEGGA